jgi:hypothetical protein
LPKENALLVDAAAERCRQYCSKAKFFSLHQLRNKAKRLVARARCLAYLDKRRRCDECHTRRLVHTEKLSCVGLGLCSCTKESKIVPGEMMRIVHDADLWRQRKCKKQSSVTAETNNEGCGQECHRDLNAVAMLCAILVIDIRCKGRSKPLSFFARLNSSMNTNETHHTTTTMTIINTPSRGVKCSCLIKSVNRFPVSTE